MLDTAQTWTLLGSIFGLMTAMMTVVSTNVLGQMRSLSRELKAELSEVRIATGSQITELRTEMAAGFAQVDTRSVAMLQVMDARFSAVDTRLDGVDRRLEGIDGDIQVLTQKVFGQ